MKQQYKAYFSAITVPSGLITQTRTKIARERSRAASPLKVSRYALAAAFCALFLLAASILPRLSDFMQISDNSSVSPVPSATESVVSTPPVSNSTIKINELGKLSDSPSVGSGPDINRVEAWTFQDFCKLLGFDPLPAEIPEGLTLASPDTRDISFHDDRRVDFYNTWYVLYTDGQTENSKSISVHINPSFIPYWSVPRAYQLQGEVQLDDVDALLHFGETSEINGTKVTIWHKSSGTVWNYGAGAFGETLDVTDYYCADFEYRNVGFTVAAQNGVTQEEFITVLESIIK